MKKMNFKNKFSGIALLIVIMLLFSCNKENITPVTEVNSYEATGLETAIKFTQPVQLEGFTRFEVYLVGEHRYLFTGDQVFLNCLAWLSPTGKNTCELYFEEYLGEPSPATLYRQTTIEGHISSSGQLKFLWEDQIHTVLEHTGIDVHGPGVNADDMVYKGYYDGVSLYVEQHLIGQQIQPATFDMYWKDPSDPTVLFKGPIQLKFSIELTVVN